MYPSDEFFAVYRTRNPVIALFGAFGAALLATSLYLLYDYVVRKEFSRNSAILKAKRQYVRFISHEVSRYIKGVSLVQAVGI